MCQLQKEWDYGRERGGKAPAWGVIKSCSSEERERRADGRRKWKGEEEEGHGRAEFSVEIILIRTKLNITVLKHINPINLWYKSWNLDSLT